MPDSPLPTDPCALDGLTTGGGTTRKVGIGLLRVLRMDSCRQLIRYGMVGLTQNSVGYGVYLFLTWLGVDPKLVVGIGYPAAMLVSFWGNKKYTFTHPGGTVGAGVRFLCAHSVNYCLNLAMLYVLVDRLRYPHQLVQLAAIFVCAAFLFIILRFFVFRTRAV